MKPKTLSTYLDKLSTTRQDYIVMCVQKYSGRPDFHRGLLPFLPCQEAADCLKANLEVIKTAQGLEDQEAARKALMAERFVRQTISIFSHTLLTRVAADEDYQVIHLNSKKMMKHYRHRYDKKFNINMREFGWQSETYLTGQFELQMVSRNQWKVTGNATYLSIVAQLLADIFSLT